MHILRSRLLILIVLTAISLPQLYRTVHFACHDHRAVCVEVNNQHFHESHPECKVCDHLLPAINPFVFSEVGFVLDSTPFLFLSNFYQHAPSIPKDLTQFRGPPGFKHFC